MNKYWGKSLGAFFLVLLTMPLGHALMIIMEKHMEATTLHYSAFLMGFVGMVVTIVGVYVKGDTKQTLYGLFGGLLFWTGWVEFLLAYFAARFGTHYDILGTGTVTSITSYVDGLQTVNDMYISAPSLDTLSGVDHTALGVKVEQLKAVNPSALKAVRGSRPEYLIMPATFGFWMMFMMIYLFSVRSGCLFLIWCQRQIGHIIAKVKGQKMQPSDGQLLELKPMAHHTSIVTFIELNVMMWSCYLLLMFCYDPVFLGPSHPVTLFIAIGCLVGSFFMFRRQLHMASWGMNIRMAVSTVIVFWTVVEIMGRNGILKEIWIEPQKYMVQMLWILIAFIVIGVYLIWEYRREKR